MRKVPEDTIAESIRRLQVLAGDHEQLRKFLWDAWAGAELTTWAAISQRDLRQLHNPFGVKECRDELSWSRTFGESPAAEEPPTTLSESP